MQTFFSGTDTNTLLEEGSERNHFVSLIVNNRGVYTAGITRKVTSRLTEEITYKSFSDEEITCSRDFTESQYVEWFNLDIEKEDSQDSFRKTLEARLDEIYKAKEAAEKAKSTPKIYGRVDHSLGKYGIINPNYTKDKAFSKGSQKSLFDDEPNPDKAAIEAAIEETVAAKPTDFINPTMGVVTHGKTTESLETTRVPSFKFQSPDRENALVTADEEDWDILNLDFDKVPVDSKKIKTATVKLLTGNALAQGDNVNLKRCKEKSQSSFDKAFDSYSSFEDFIEPFVDWVIEGCLDSVLSTDEDISKNADIKAAIVAYNIEKMLSDVPENIYKSKIIEQLQIYQTL